RSSLRISRVYHSFILCCSMSRPPPSSTLFPYTTLFRSGGNRIAVDHRELLEQAARAVRDGGRCVTCDKDLETPTGAAQLTKLKRSEEHTSELSHVKISYAVFCLKKKKKKRQQGTEVHGT